MIKPRTPPGVLELLPREQMVFQRMLDTIRGTFEAFGFLPIETPVMELSDVLLTKSGGETERQVYFVQSTGGLEAYQNRLASMLLQGDGTGETSMVMPEDKPELALRFDLTVPLARYVAEHENDLAFPFRRYQMQRVYRGERQQRGRFREFYQCDIDVIGKDTLSNRFDAEIPAVINAVFDALRIGAFTIHLNHRKLLLGFLEDRGISIAQMQASVLRELDKLDKRGADAVTASMTGALGLAGDTAAALMQVAATRARGQAAALAALDGLAAGGVLFEQGRAELRAVLQQLQALGVPDARIALNLSIARGLDYYTGMVYETVLDAHPEIGSVCSGGRYDDLASHYSRSRLPGVGISIGLTRLFWQLREAGVLQCTDSSVDVLVALPDDDALPRSLEISQRLRAGGLNVETQMEPRKLARQFQYADRVGIRFVVIQGADELARGVVAVKDLRRGEQFEVDPDSLAGTLRVEREQGRATGTKQAPTG